jgi:hypothetical protein
MSTTESLGLSELHWRKSSYSTNETGACVECSPLGSAAWRKSSYSDDRGGDCVEVAQLPALRGARGAVAVRDSKDPEGPHLTFPAASFARLVRSVATDR